MSLQESRKPDEQSIRAVANGLAVIVIGSLLAIGSVHVTVFVLVAIATAALFAATAAKQLGRGHVPLISPPVFVFLGLAGYTLLQTVPLPMSWLVHLSPRAADVWSRSLLALNETGPAHASLSLDPGASMVEALKWLTYAEIFAVASVVGARRGVGFGATLMLASGLIAAITTIAHGLAGMSRVFGLYEPHFSTSRWSVGPLLNTNNLAGYLNLALFVGLGMLLSRRTKVPRWQIGLPLILILGTSMVSASRAGLLVLPVGVALLEALIRRAPDRERSLQRGVLWATLVGGVVLALLGSTRRTWDELLDKSTSKVDLMGWGVQVARDYPWFGIGRGGSEGVLSAYRTLPGHKVYGNVENFLGSWAVEWGVPVTLAAMVGFAYTLAPRRLGVGSGRRILTSAIFVGVCVLLLQNLFDLALEVPGVCIAVAMLLGTLYGAASRRPGSTPAVTTTLPVLALGALALVAIAGVVRWGLRPAYLDRDLVHALYRRTDASKSEQFAHLTDELRAAMSRHPGDAYFPLIGGLASAQAKSDPLPWLQRTLERDPFSSRAHLLLAYVLRERGALEQALLHLRLTAVSDPKLQEHSARIAASWTHDYDRLVRAIPEGPSGARSLNAMARSFGQPDRERLRIRLLQTSVQRDPDNVAARYLSATDLASALDQPQHSRRCSGERRRVCLERLEVLSGELRHLDPNSSAWAEVEAMALIGGGKPAKAEQLLAQQCPKFSERRSCLQLRIQAARRADAPELMREAAKSLALTACTTATRCAQAMTFAGDELLAIGYPAYALEFYQRAAREHPSAERWMRVANAASQAGAHAIAVEALTKTARLRGGANADLKARINRERDLALRRSFEP